MKFLIAGFGSIGRRHFRNLLHLGEEDILFYSTNQSTIDKDEIAGYIIEPSLDQALAHKPDAVIVSNPTSLHLDVAIPAARAGCHLLIEKPLSHDLGRIDELAMIVDQTGKNVLVGFQFRYHPGLQEIRKLISDGVIGKPLSVRAHWGEYLPNWHPWEDYQTGYSARADLGGGVLLTLCHPLDYLRWLFGEINEVQGFLGCSGVLGLTDVEDTAEINLKFANDMLGSVHLDYNQRPPAHRLEIIASEGTVHWNGINGELSVFQASTGKWKDYPLPLDFDRNDLFLAEMAHFLEITKTDQIPRCSLADGITVQQIIQSVNKSHREGAVVSITI